MYTFEQWVLSEEVMLKVKSSHTVLVIIGPGADPSVQAVSLQLAAITFHFPTEEHHRPSTSNKLYCLVTEAHGCEQLVQGCYSTVRQPGIELATTESVSHQSGRCLSYLATRLWVTIDYRVVTDIVHEKTRLQCQRTDLDLIGERSWREASGNRSSSGVERKLEDCALSIRPCRDDADVRRVLNRGYRPRSKQEFLPCLLQVYDVDACHHVIYTVCVHNGSSYISNTPHLTGLIYWLYQPSQFMWSRIRSGFSTAN